MFNWIKSIIARPQASYGMSDVEWFGGSRSDAGIIINQSNAMAIAAVQLCVRVLASTIASLPIQIYERQGNRRRLIEDHDYLPILNVAPNNLMSAFSWKESGMVQVLLRGNEFNQLVFKKNGKLDSIYLINHDAVQVLQTESGLSYNVQTESGRIRTLKSHEMLHVAGLGWDGITGYTPLKMASNALGLAAVTEQHGSKYFANGTHLGGQLTSDKAIDPARQREILAQFNTNFMGPTNTGKTVFLADGLKYAPTQISQEDAQYLETRKFQVVEICRIFNVPPHKVFELDRATFSNIEHQSMEFVQHSLRPWSTKKEAELNRKLFPDGKLFVSFDEDVLLRPDIKSRIDAYAKAINSGLMTPNEARAKEGLNPVDGGDELRVPVNTISITEQGVLNNATQL